MKVYKKRIIMLRKDIINPSKIQSFFIFRGIMLVAVCLPLDDRRGALLGLFHVESKTAQRVLMANAKSISRVLSQLRMFN